MANLAVNLMEMGRFDEARPLFQDYLKLQAGKFGADDPRFAGELASVAFAMVKRRHFADAEPILRRCLAIREAKESDAWTTFYTKSMLGGCLFGQKNYPDAEPLMLAGYEGMKQRQAKIPPQNKSYLPVALELLVRVYEAKGKPSEAAKWRAEFYADAEKVPAPRTE